MEIIELRNEYIENFKDLLVELQEYVVSIDKFNLNIISKDFREKYFEKTINEVNLNSGKIFLAKENEKILGAIVGFIEPYSTIDEIIYKCPKKAIISELIVSKNCRNNGVGQKLLTHAENYFKSVGCEYISLELFSYNKNAESFYTKNNYKDRVKTMFKKL